MFPTRQHKCRSLKHTWNEEWSYHNCRRRIGDMSRVTQKIYIQQARWAWRYTKCYVKDTISFRWWHTVRWRWRRLHILTGKIRQRGSWWWHWFDQCLTGQYARASDHSVWSCHNRSDCDRKKSELKNWERIATGAVDLGTRCTVKINENI